MSRIKIGKKEKPNRTSHPHFGFSETFVWRNADILVDTLHQVSRYSIPVKAVKFWIQIQNVHHVGLWFVMRICDRMYAHTIVSCDILTEYANLARDNVATDLQSAGGPSFSHDQLLPFSSAGYMNTLIQSSIQRTLIKISFMRWKSWSETLFNPRYCSSAAR